MIDYPDDMQLMIEYQMWIERETRSADVVKYLQISETVQAILNSVSWTGPCAMKRCRWLFVNAKDDELYEVPLNIH